MFFLNRLTDEEFANRMAETSFTVERVESSIPMEWDCKGVTLKHRKGDAADPTTLLDVMSAVKYEAAIVMG